MIASQSFRYAGTRYARGQEVDASAWPHEDFVERVRNGLLIPNPGLSGSVPRAFVGISSLSVPNNDDIILNFSPRGAGSVEGMSVVGGKLVAEVAGWYHVDVNYMNWNGAVGGSRWANLVRNAGDPSEGYYDADNVLGSAASDVYTRLNGLVPLNVGDTLAVEVGQSSGSPLDLFDTQMSCYLVAAT